MAAKKKIAANPAEEFWADMGLRVGAALHRLRNGDKAGAESALAQAQEIIEQEGARLGIG